MWKLGQRVTYAVVCFCSSATGTENCFLGGSLFYPLLIWNHGVYYEPIDPRWINKAGWKKYVNQFRFSAFLYCLCTCYVKYTYLIISWKFKSVNPYFVA